MIDPREDQAAGLRRLFRKAPPHVLALFATGHQAPANALRALHRLAAPGEPVLVLDESCGEHGLGAILGQDDGPDLLHVLDGRARVAQLVKPVPGLAGRLSVAATAMALPLLDEERRTRLLAALQTLQRGHSFLAVHAPADTAARPSPLVFAAPRRLVVVEASGRGATEAYQLIKHLALSGAGSVQVALTRARHRDDAAALYRRLDELVRRHVGIPMCCLGEVERDDLARALIATAPPAPSAAESPFLRRLAGLTAHPRKAAAPRTN